ncbi:hypothetical protein ACJX0J_026776, partial [Zea mays]
MHRLFVWNVGNMFWNCFVQFLILSGAFDKQSSRTCTLYHLFICDNHVSSMIYIWMVKLPVFVLQQLGIAHPNNSFSNIDHIMVNTPYFGFGLTFYIIHYLPIYVEKSKRL